MRDWDALYFAARFNSLVKTFHYFPPAPEEQRGFVIQLGGSLLGLVAMGILFFRTSDAGLRGVMIGAAIGVVTILARSMWHLETKAQRAQNAEIGVDENGLQITDAAGKTQNVSWEEIEQTEVLGGRLKVAWANGELKFGSREIENGMELIQLIAARGGSTPSVAPNSNFIPLSPK